MAGLSTGRVAGKLQVFSWIVGLAWFSCLLQGAVGESVKNLEQGYFFDWTPQGQTPPVPTTAQCETINIKWGRQGATGPNPTGPYYLQVYTSAYIYPFVIPAGSESSLNFDWPVPFMPGTQYQICMFDKNGVTGGCQATYTVYQAPNSTIQNPPTCQNLTYPQPGQVLGVEGLVSNGPISQYGWIDQCTDISVRPLNGTPPYTFTIAPALHPPYNITSNTMDAINWTVSLTWGAPFFISLVDSTGLMWSQGPLHSGGGGPTACLALDDIPTVTGGGIKSYVAVASGIGGAVGGLLIGLIGAFCLFRRKDRGRPDGLHRKSSSVSITTPVLTAAQFEGGPYRDVPSGFATLDNSRSGLMRQGSSYHVEPFIMPNEFGNRSNTAGPSSQASRSPPTTVYDGNAPTGTQTITSVTQDHHSRTGAPSSPTSVGHGTIAPPPPIQTEARSGSQVYVVHHDGGRAPVTVYTADGTEVVELPPRYIDSDSGPAPQSSTSDSNPPTEPSAPPLHPLPPPPPPPTQPVRTPLMVNERRQLGPTPLKGPRRGGG